MRRLIVLAVTAVLTLGLAPATLAAAPNHVREIFTSEFDFAAGEACDFHYVQTNDVKQNTIEFGDVTADGSYLFTINARVVHRNADTGYTLTEMAQTVERFVPGAAVDKMIGIFWHLRDADGRLVAVYAGQWIMDWSGQAPVIVKITPNLSADFWGVLCPALGGNPA
jgi:hypothetical protein